MKRVFTSPDSAELGLLKNMLEKAGIPCVHMNEQMARMIPSAPFPAELWVEDEADYPVACRNRTIGGGLMRASLFVRQAGAFGGGTAATGNCRAPPEIIGVRSRTGCAACSASLRRQKQTPV